ncbi:hypothetical protein WG906_15175 [Pedobacter sp. P351]|uniref:hypothetical protein n=1 Tax=Pedobacter superstes TaxID=3133441 RepID=UPI0030AC2764
MKSGKYSGLLDKFYAGTASAEEISLLQSEALVNEQDILYTEMLKEERGQKMDWEFEDFMNDIPSDKVEAFPARRVWMKRILSAAAMVAIIGAAYILWPQPQTDKMANVPASNKTAEPNKELRATAVSPENEIKEASQGAEKVTTVSKINRDYAVNTDKKRPVQKSIRQADTTGVSNNLDSPEYLVIVNGQPITNEADAIAITRESLAMISQNLTLTVDELKPIKPDKNRAIRHPDQE